MSVEVMSAVWKHSPQKEGPLLILLALADYAHDDGTNAFPSIVKLAEKARMSERNARYCLRKLEAAGEIEATGTHASGTTIYRVILPYREGQNLPGAKSAGGQFETDNTSNSGPQLPPNRHREPSTRSTSDTPYGLFAAICDAAGLDVSQFTQRDKDRHIAVAKRLRDEGVTESESRRITGWLVSQQWRTQPVTVFTVQKSLSEWRAAGRPEQEKTRRPKTQADLNKGGTGRLVS